MTDPTTANSAWNFSEAQAEFAPHTLSAFICFDGNLTREIDQLEASLPALKAKDDMENRPAEAPAVARRLVELHEQLKAKEREFLLQSMGGRWKDLVKKHPPTEQHQELGLNYNIETFSVAAIVASCISPKLTEADVLWMQEHLAVGQFRRLWNTTLAVNQVGLDGVGKALSDTASRLASVQSSTTASPEASPGASSLADGS